MAWLFPRIYDRVTAATEEACYSAWRDELLGTLTGRVLEVGAGTGANLGHYGAGVTELVVTDPEPAMLERLGAKVDLVEPPVPPEVRATRADALGFDDASFDAVVATLVLCSVPDQAAALAEIRRVLKPGGRYVFLEHVAAEGRPRRLRWQRRIEPIWKLAADGCHLTRRTEHAIATAGFLFDPDDVTHQSARKAAPVVRPTIRGTAFAPGG